MLFSPPVASPRASDEGPFDAGPRRWARALARRLAGPLIARRLARRRRLVERALGWLALQAVDAERASRDWLELPTWADEAAALAAEGTRAAGLELQGSAATSAHARSTIHLARRALAAFHAGDRAEGDRLAERLFAWQRADGGFPERLCRFGRTLGGSSSIAATSLAIRVAEAQVTAGFAAQGEALPGEIAEADQRWQAVWHATRDLPQGATVLEAGCGSGRILHRLACSRPDLRIVGVDPDLQGLTQAARRLSESSGILAAGDEHLPIADPLARQSADVVEPRDELGLPAGDFRCLLRQGSLKRLPWPTAGCDLALAVESLEHALWPARAIAELARVVRPGGRLLVIDKRGERQVLSRHEPWEQWFYEADLRTWLAPWCDRVSFVPIAHGRQGQRGLFFACQAQRSAGPAPRWRESAESSRA